MVWRNCQNFTTLRGTLYLHSTPKGENEDLLLFMLPKMHQTPTLNGCHRDAGHQAMTVLYPLAYVTPNQTAKTVAKFLYGGYISIFGALARLLSDRGTSFTSSIIEELCKILGTQQLQIMSYHPQTTGLVERSHQMIMHMIGKLRED